MKTTARICILSVFLCALAGSACAGNLGCDVVFQTAPFQSLNVGVYDGAYSFADLKEHGNFGLGTLNGLDGEMVGVDGKFYQVRQDGMVMPVPGRALTPFAMVTFFEEDLRMEEVNAGSLAELGGIIDRGLPSRNLYYALRVDGVFEYVKVRSAPAQQKPYRPLAEALKGQTVFEYRNIAGTLVGFRSPAFTEKVSIPGYHFHFISKDREAGGHVLDLHFKNLNVRMDRCTSLLVIMPECGDYFSADLENPKSEAPGSKHETISNP